MVVFVLVKGSTEANKGYRASKEATLTRHDQCCSPSLELEARNGFHLPPKPVLFPGKHGVYNHYITTTCRVYGFSTPISPEGSRVFRVFFNIYIYIIKKKKNLRNALPAPTLQRAARNKTRRKVALRSSASDERPVSSSPASAQAASAIWVWVKIKPPDHRF